MQCPFTGQLASDDTEPDKDGATPQDPSDNTASQATLEKGATPSSPNQTLPVTEEVTTKKTQVIETCKEEERPSATAPESDSQPRSEAATGSNLSVTTTLPSSTHASVKLAEQQTVTSSDISTDDNPEAVQIPVDKPSDINCKALSCSASTSTKETGSTAAETPQECNSVTKSVSEQDKDNPISHETHNLSVRPDDNENHTNTEQHTFAKQAESKEDEAAGDERCLYSDDPKTKTTECSADPPSVRKETAQSTAAVDTKSNEKTNTSLAEGQKQQSDNRDVSKSTPSGPSQSEGGEGGSSSDITNVTKQ
ncbi:uncharacterized protein LOC115006959 [Cottoperca gobio]|uniref:Uncharacterized protein LOC115006959 n=1 Tax=Cottoperca gobio TaxID=56716 RepID=A0A6J2PJI9_COTGO|nr:uncharacterized protein LOC115006959 [Cottoperca gobio]